MQTPTFSHSGHFSLGLRSIIFAIVTTLLITTAGCDAFSSGDDGYTASGTIMNTTERGVDNATIEFSQNGSSAQTTTTNDTGYYEISGLDGGEYDVSIQADGYPDTTITTSVTSSVTLPTMTLLGTATVTGSIADATTGSGLANAEVAFTFQSQDVDTSRSDADLITTTTSTGSWTITNAPTGQFVCVIRAPGFIPSVIPDIDFQEGSNDLGQASTSESLEDGQLRIVLEWGENPSDLDSHLTGPDGSGGRFHVYYANQTPSGAGAYLDVDDITSYGPETTTITDARSGTYRYSVYNFSNSSDDGAVGIDDSPARVTVYDSEGQRATYSPPAASAGDGNTWRVLEIDGGSLSSDDNGGDTFGYYFADGSGDTSVFSRAKKEEKKTPMPLEPFDRPLDSF